MPRKTSYIILFLFFLNFLPALLLLNEGLFHHDSVVLARAVEDTYKTGHLHPAIKGRFGSVIINLILYLPFYLLGHNADFCLRLSSALFHSASIVVLFLFVKDLFKNEIQAFFAALFFSFTPVYFSPNTYGKEHGAGIFFLLLSFYLLSQGIKKNSGIRIAISSFLAAFTVTIRESLLLALPLYFLLYFSPEIYFQPLKIKFAKERLNLKLLFCAVFPFAVTLFIALSAYLGSEIYKSVFIRDNSSSIFRGLFSFILAGALNDLAISTPLILVAYFMIGLIKMAREKNGFYFLLFFIWWLLIFYLGNISTYCPRYLDIIAIPFYVFASYALYDLYRKNKRLCLGIVIYCVFTMFIFMLPMLIFRHNYNGEKRFALFVKEKTENNAVIIAMDDNPFMEYYGKRKTRVHPIGDKKKITFFIESLKADIEAGIPVYITGSGFEYDQRGIFQKEINDTFSIQLIGEKLIEDYHRPELKFQTYKGALSRIVLKNPN